MKKPFKVGDIVIAVGGITETSASYSGRYLGSRVKAEILNVEQLTTHTRLKIKLISPYLASTGWIASRQVTHRLVKKAKR